LILWDRLRRLLAARDGGGQEQSEDPRRTLDNAYARQLQLQQQMRQGLAEVASSRKRLELQARQLERSAAQLEDQARRALEQGREDLAQEALSRRALASGELDDLRGHLALLSSGEKQLVEAAGRLDLQLQRFRARKEAVKAVYTAAQARARVGESLAGFDRDDSELLLALQRAQDRIADSQARAEALEELLASGIIGELGSSTGPVYRELAKEAGEQDIATELARLKARMADESPPLRAAAQPDNPSRPGDRTG
jgi:phage shock protein A